MRYYVTISGRTVEIEIDGERILVDGEPVEAKVETVPGTDLRHLMIGGRSHVLLARPGARKGIWTLTVNGRTLSAEAIDERTRAIREMSGGSAAEVEKVLVAPMPGLIVRVDVEVGATVAAGQGLVVVEAMKMENELKAPAAGIVKKVEVTAGSTVEKGAVLVVLE
jgi:acetyl/propionyl-CoA carboxylase alpha subunit